MCASVYELQFEPDVAIETFYEPDAIGKKFYETTATVLTKGAKRKHIQTQRGGMRRSVKDNLVPHTDVTDANTAPKGL